MTYDEAVEARIPADRVRAEIRRHGLAFEDFVSEFGVAASYAGADVLGWLGY